MPRIELPLEIIPTGSLLRIDDGREGIVVVRTGDTVAAFEDVCPHAGWRLSDGELVNGLLECPGHGWEFDPTTGRCVTAPAHCLKPVSVLHQQRCISVAVERGQLDIVPAVIGDGSTIV